MKLLNHGPTWKTLSLRADFAKERKFDVTRIKLQTQAYCSVGVDGKNHQISDARDSRDSARLWKPCIGLVFDFFFTYVAMGQNPDT